MSSLHLVATARERYIEECAIRLQTPAWADHSGCAVGTEGDTMHIGVYGAGYLGTVVSACLADFGNPVTCYDADGSRIYATSQGSIPFYEKNLKDVIKRNIRAGRLIYSNDLESFAGKCTVIFLAEDSSRYLEDVAVKLAQELKNDTILVMVTPAPVGTASRLEPRLKAAPNRVTIVSHPLFLTDGCAVEDFNWPDRIVVGTRSTHAVQTLKQIYRPLAMRGVPIIVTNHETAELVREASTAFLATKISFINEVSALCERVSADAVDLALALGLDKKIGPRCLQPGAGFGGPLSRATWMRSRNWRPATECRCACSAPPARSTWRCATAWWPSSRACWNRFPARSSASSASPSSRIPIQSPGLLPSTWPGR